MQIQKYSLELCGKDVQNVALLWWISKNQKSKSNFHDFSYGLYVAYFNLACKLFLSVFDLEECCWVASA